MFWGTYVKNPSRKVPRPKATKIKKKSEKSRSETKALQSSKNTIFNDVLASQIHRFFEVLAYQNEVQKSVKIPIEKLGSGRLPSPPQS